MKKISLFFIAIFIIALALTACSSSEPEETGPSEPDPTAVVNVPDQPDEPEEAEEAPAQEPTEVPEVDASEGLFDVEAMVDGLEYYVMRPEDMPDAYKIVVDGEQHMTNLKVINSVGEVEGKHYLAATGREDGWYLELGRVHKADLIPATIKTYLQVYDTAEGAQTAFTDYLDPYIDEESEAHFIEDACDLGDACVMYYYERLEPTTETTILQYEVAFVYKNTLAVVMGRGLDVDMNPDYLLNIASLMFDKIDTAAMAE
jgi:hypothetical protein